MKAKETIALRFKQLKIIHTSDIWKEIFQNNNLKNFPIILQKFKGK